MRFELLALFDSSDSPGKNHPCTGFILDTNPSDRWVLPRPKPSSDLCVRRFRIGIAGCPTMIADHKRIQIAIVKNGLDIAGLNARA